MWLLTSHVETSGWIVKSGVFHSSSLWSLFPHWGDRARQRPGAVCGVLSGVPCPVCLGLFVGVPCLACRRWVVRRRSGGRQGREQSRQAVQTRDCPTALWSLHITRPLTLDENGSFEATSATLSGTRGVPKVGNGSKQQGRRGTFDRSSVPCRPLLQCCSAFVITCLLFSLFFSRSLSSCLSPTSHSAGCRESAWSCLPWFAR